MLYNYYFLYLINEWQMCGNIMNCVVYFHRKGTFFSWEIVLFYDDSYWLKGQETRSCFISKITKAMQVMLKFPRPLKFLFLHLLKIKEMVVTYGLKK